MIDYLILFAVGAVAGVVNIIAGGGSFLTLPTLIFLGLPPGIANATNRVGILLQNVGAVWGFHRWSVLDWTSLLWAGLPSMAGSIVGVWLALVIPDLVFQKVLAALMVVIALWALATSSSSPAGTGPSRGKWAPGVAIAFFLVGIYGGFVQAGVGFLVLAVTSWKGLDLVRANAVKVLAILLFTALSLAIFSWEGRVEWIPGLFLAAGNVVGGLAGVRLTIRKGHTWIKRFVTVTVILFAIKLWIS